MAFPEDYSDAHRRHWHDAELLFTSGRLANADHLYGLSAECGLKAVLRMEGQPVVPPYREHADKLWDEFRTFADGRKGAMYLSRLPRGNPFSDWAVADRYAHRNPFDPPRVTPHRNAARQIRVMLQHVMQGGQP